MLINVCILINKKICVGLLSFEIKTEKEKGGYVRRSSSWIFSNASWFDLPHSEGQALKSWQTLGRSERPNSLQRLLLSN